MATRTGYSSGWEYINHRTPREFMTDVSAWSATFMTPLGIVANALTGDADTSAPSDPSRPSSPSKHTGPRPARIPKGANIINMGKEGEAPSVQTQMLLKGMFVDGVSELSADATKAAVAAAERGKTILAQQKAKWSAKPRVP